MKRNPSEIIREFLELLDESHEYFNNSVAMIEAENSKTLINTHSLEDCDDENLYDFAYQWRRDLRERRKACDIKVRYENIHKFAISEQNKPTLKRIRGLLKEQIASEEYLGIPYKDRTFKKGEQTNEH